MSEQDLLNNITDYEKVITHSLEDTIKNPDSDDYELFENFESTFFNGIYLPREYNEKRILANIQKGNKVISIEGTSGCGKTTLVKKVLKDLHYTSYPSETFNFNSIFYDGDLPDTKDLPGWIKAISTKLTNRLLNKYFLNYSKALEGLIEFCLFNNIGGFEEDFTNERMSLLALSGLLDIGEKETLEWFRNHTDQNEVKSIRAEILKKVRYPHLIVYMKYRKIYTNKFILVLDNVDRLPRQFQPYCYEFAVGFSYELKNYAHVIICIRHENAHRAREIPSDRAEHVEPIKLVDLSPNQQDYNYLKPNEFNQILKNRQIFYFKYRSENPVLNLIEKLTNALSHSYTEYYLIDLANQSIRTALDYHCQLIKYLFRNIDLAFLEEVITNPIHSRTLNSMFLAWIADSHEIVNIQSLNIVDAIEDSENKRYVKHGCDLSYLIITFLINSASKYTQPELFSIKLDQIYKHVSIIGFSFEDIRNTIYKLYNFRKNEFGHIINIENDELIKDETSLSLESLISLNYRGKCLIEKITVSFTYINRLLFGSNFYGSKDLLKPNYFDFENYKYHFLYNLKFFAKIAFVHTLELVRIARRINQDNWLRFYKSYFCIDFMFQLSRIIDRNRKFIINFISREKKDENILNHYLKILNILDNLFTEETNIISAKTIQIFNYNKYIDDIISGELSLDDNSNFLRDNYLELIAPYISDNHINKIKDEFHVLG